MAAANRTAAVVRRFAPFRVGAARLRMESGSFSA